MADPLSIVASVIGIASAALKASILLYEVVETIIDAPEELSAILNDTDDFRNVISSLEAALKDPVVQQVVKEDEGLTEVVARIRGPIENCCTILDQVRPRIQKQLKPVGNGKLKVSSKRWIWQKSEVREYMSRLHSNKTTLDTALTSVVFLCSLRAAGRNPDISSGRRRRRSNDTDAGFALKKYVESLAPDTTTLLGPFGEKMKIQTSGTSQFTPSTSDATVDPPQQTSLDPLERLKKAENQRDEFLKAARIGDDLVVELMIEQGTDINVKGPEGKAALHLAAENGNETVVKALLRRDANPNLKTSAGGSSQDRKFRGGTTALHWAAMGGHDEVIKLLIEYKADVSAQNVTGRSPIQDAIMRWRTSSAKILIEAGADISSKDEEGWSAIHEAAFNGVYDSVEYLIQKGSLIDPVTTDLHWLGHRWMCHATPLTLAARNGHLTVVRLLAESGANLRASCLTGDTALHAACVSGHLQVVKYLIEDAGVDIEIKDPVSEETPLLKAASTGRVSVILYLLDKGADFTAKTNWGRDCLQHARLHQPGKNPEAVAQIEQWFENRKGHDDKNDDDEGHGHGNDVTKNMREESDTPQASMTHPP